MVEIGTAGTLPIMTMWSRRCDAPTHQQSHLVVLIGKYAADLGRGLIVIIIGSLPTFVLPEGMPTVEVAVDGTILFLHVVSY